MQSDAFLIKPLTTRFYLLVKQITVRQLPNESCQKQKKAFIKTKLNKTQYNYLKLSYNLQWNASEMMTMSANTIVLTGTDIP